MRLIYLLLCTAQIMGCSSVKHQLAGSSADDHQEPPTPQVIFINYKAVREADGSIQVEFINTILADGTLKKNNVDEPMNHDHETGFHCVQLAHDASPVDSLCIPSPFIRDIEYTTSDGLFSKKRIELDSAEFSVRLQLNPNTKFIALKTRDKTFSTISR